MLCSITSSYRARTVAIEIDNVQNFSFISNSSGLEESCDFTSDKAFDRLERFRTDFSYIESDEELAKVVEFGISIVMASVSIEQFTKKSNLQDKFY